MGRCDASRLISFTGEALMDNSNRIFLTINGQRMPPAKLNPSTAVTVVACNCPDLITLPDLSVATFVLIYNCPGLTALPAMPAATCVRIVHCPGLTVLNAGTDKRGYQFVAARVRNQWSILAGCRNFSLSDARKHWGPGGPSDRPNCLAMVEKLIAEIRETE